jgi:metacaspase-1
MKRKVEETDCVIEEEQQSDDIRPTPKQPKTSGKSSVESLALLVGINYIGTSSRLHGCINDVENMRIVLVNKLKFKPSSITMITDNTRVLPTKSAIRTAIQSMAAKCHENSNITNVWFHYSGHGSYVRDRNSDESDRRDETLCPIDYLTAGMYIDDELREDLALFPTHVRVTCVLDCCHSGTGADLKFTYNAGNKSKIENKNKDVPADVICLSGCRDTQTSADAFIAGQSQGALTASVLDALYRSAYSITCFTLLKLTRVYMINNGYSQVPQLTSSRVVNLDTRFL